jgi:hypothetical protein
VRTEWLQRWWCKKYNRPRKDPLLAEYMPEELMIEYLEDVIEIDPAEEFPRDIKESGRYVHRTGDALLDKWQEAAASGQGIDFDEAFRDPEARKQFDVIKAASRARHQQKHGVGLEEIHGDYTSRR